MYEDVCIILAKPIEITGHSPRMPIGFDSFIRLNRDTVKYDIRKPSCGN